MLRDVLAVRPPAEKKRWYESSNAGALISGVVALGSVLVTAWLGYFTQRMHKEREIDLARRDAVLAQEREVMSGVNDVLSLVLYATGERLKIASGRYDSLSTPRLDSLLEETNRADARWAREQHSRDMDVRLYFTGSSPVISGWDSTRAALPRYVECVENAYHQYQRSNAPQGTCVTEQRTAANAVAAFRAKLIDQYRDDFAQPTATLIARRAGGPQP